MKIQGTNLARIHAYKQHLQGKKEQNKTEKQTDELNISSEAKQLQKSEKLSAERKNYVKEIKQSVDSGEYRIRHEATAQKMIDFWSRRS